MTDLRPQLRLLAAPSAAACPTLGCELPVAGSFGLCEPCERVYRTLLVLCDRLLDRDVARLEYDTPGLVLAARATIAAILVSPPPAAAGTSDLAVAADHAWAALLPTPADVASVRGSLAELEAAVNT